MRVQADTPTFWYDPGDGERAVEEHEASGKGAANAILALTLPQVSESVLGHAWPKAIRWLAAPGKPPNPVMVGRVPSIEPWVSPSENALGSELASLAIPAKVSWTSARRLSTLGRWRFDAATDQDSFRRFLWCYAGLEVIASWIGPSIHDDLLARLEPEEAARGPWHELFWPLNDQGREPGRNFIARFAATALHLSPSTAAEDVTEMRELARYRNRIHGGEIDPEEAPSARASRIWRRYSCLAAEYLSGQLRATRSRDRPDN